MRAFGLERSRLSTTAGWEITSNIAHPGVAPTSLAARPEVGRTKDTTEVRMIRWLSARGLIVGTVASATPPALMAAVAPEATDGGFYGPRWPGSAAEAREAVAQHEECVATVAGIPGTDRCHLHLKTLIDRQPHDYRLQRRESRGFSAVGAAPEPNSRYR